MNIVYFDTGIHQVTSPFDFQAIQCLIKHSGLRKTEGFTSTSQVKCALTTSQIMFKTEKQELKN